MQSSLAVLTLVLTLGMVLTRVITLRRQGIAAMNFGKIDKSDFLILPFVFFYFFLIVANAFNLQAIKNAQLY